MIYKLHFNDFQEVQIVELHGSADISVFDRLGQVADTEDWWHVSKSNVVYYGRQRGLKKSLKGQEEK